MFVEPCCYHKHLTAAVESALRGRVVQLVSFGDVTVMHLLDFFTHRVRGGKIVLVLVRVTSALISCIEKLMEERMPDGNWLISEFTLISQGHEHTEVVSRLARFRENGRLTVCEDANMDTRVLTVADNEHTFTVTGPLSQNAGYALHVWMLSADPDVYDDFALLFGYHRQAKKV